MPRQFRQCAIHSLQLLIVLILFSSNLISCRPYPEENLTENRSFRTDKQLYDFLNNAQQFSNDGFNLYSPDIGGQYGLGYSQPQFAFPRVQPQLVLYGPGGQGQPILINPGSSPGNFLVPSGGGDPNFVIRGDIPSQQRPVFIAGYPKPAHIPPIEKDAEEIPTNPAKIPPLATGNPSVHNNNDKPEKLETFNESSNKDDDLPKYPKLHPSSLQPGQRFFILNGDQVYSNFAADEPQFGQGFNNIIRYPQGFPTSTNNQFDIENTKTPTIQFKNSANEQPEFGAFRFTPPKSSDILQYQDDPTNEAIIVEATFDDAAAFTRLKPPSEELATTSSKDDDESNSSMAQAVPSAVALAGPGGVAGSAPRGTAIVGKGGVAVVSPKATAVAGPKENRNKNKRKPFNPEE